MRVAAAIDCVPYIQQVAAVSQVTAQADREVFGYRLVQGRGLLRDLVLEVLQ